MGERRQKLLERDPGRHPGDLDIFPHLQTEIPACPVDPDRKVCVIAEKEIRFRFA